MSDSAKLEAFVTAAKEQGATDDFLVAMLRDKGWPAKDVYAMFAQQYPEQTGVVLPEPPGRLEAAREAFLHLHGAGLQGPPASLADVALTASDPFGGQPYEYRKLDGERYEVCAQFGAASPTASGPAALFWAHPAGRKCFDISSARSAPPPPNYFR